MSTTCRLARDAPRASRRTGEAPWTCRIVQFDIHFFYFFTNLLRNCHWTAAALVPLGLRIPRLPGQKTLEFFAAELWLVAFAALFMQCQPVLFVRTFLANLSNNANSLIILVLGLWQQSTYFSLSRLLTRLNKTGPSITPLAVCPLDTCRMEQAGATNTVHSCAFSFQVNHVQLSLDVSHRSKQFNYVNSLQRTRNNVTLQGQHIPE